MPPLEFTWKFLSTIGDTCIPYSLLLCDLVSFSAKCLPCVQIRTLYHYFVNPYSFTIKWKKSVIAPYLFLTKKNSLQLIVNNVFTFLPWQPINQEVKKNWFKLDTGSKKIICKTHVIPMNTQTPVVGVSIYNNCTTVEIFKYWLSVFK